MRLISVLLVSLILTACATNNSKVLVQMKFPDVPPELLIECPDLAQVDTSTSKLSDVLETVTDNYSDYYECKDKVDTWVDWYTKQKQIFDNIK
jgi:hypothetical protein